MNRKTLIAALSVSAALLVCVAVLIALLYRGDDSKSGGDAEVRKTEALFCAVPSNAVAVAKFSDLRTAAENVLSGDVASKGGFARSIAGAVASGRLKELSGRPFAVSFQYSREIVPLYIFDAGRSSDTDFDADVQTVSQLSSEAGWAFVECDCSKIITVDEKLRGRRILLASPVENLVNSSVRHLNDGVSVYDSEGFGAALSHVGESSLLMVSASDADQILPSLLSSSCRKYYSFLSSFALWCGFDLAFEGDGVRLYGHTGNLRQTDFANVFTGLRGADCNVFAIAPAYSLSVLSIPLHSYKDYIREYDLHLDRLMKLSTEKQSRKDMASKRGLSPEEWAAGLRPEEVATVSFRKGDEVRTVNMLRSSSIKESSEIQEFAYSGYMASLFGDIFRREDESCSFAIDGWLITGAREDLEEWAGGRAREYSLYAKLCDADLKQSIPSSGNAVLYYSVNEDGGVKGGAFSASAGKRISGELENCDIMPAFLCVDQDRKGGLSIEASLQKADMKRMKAPETETDAHVSVPGGPFTVKNSATGRENKLLQNQNLSLSLRDENGKGVWTVPFSGKLCGAVSSVDYFANGKIQFLFCSGSKVYLLDRLGRFVSPFPIDLGKKIVLGPAAYDFSGSKKYNILVLHEDNTIRMYNLQGKTPQGWKDITCEDTIVSLPERIVCGGESVWVVRTSRQTLIYPFMGGESLSKFTGNSMLRPDSEVKVLDGGVLTAVSYNGKTQKIKIK